MTTQTIKLGDVCEINPATKLSKGTISAWVSMDKLDNHYRYVETYETKPFQSGSKFMQGDTLLARITPCLENGKTAQVTFLNDGEVGGGSTEFIVLRAIEGTTVPDWIYYLSRTDDFREHAIRAMVGTSGRQRVQVPMLSDFTLTLPPLAEQRRVAGILGSLDEKIENNRRLIRTTEALARTLFKKHIVSNEESEGWENGKVSEVLLTLESGSRPKGGAVDNDGIPSIGAENVIGLGQYDFSKEKFISKEYFAKLNRGKIQSEDVVLYKDGAYVGKKSMFMNDFPHKVAAINEHVFILRHNEKLPSQFYLFFWLDQEEITQMIINAGVKAAQPGLNQKSVGDLPVLIPPVEIVKQFDDAVRPLIEKIFELARENQTLAATRDKLLRKLIK
jgi:type I restriction enzyme S subunit